MPCTFRLLPPRAGKCWLFRARERTRHVLRQVFIVGNGLVAARKMGPRLASRRGSARKWPCCCYTSLPACGPPMRLAWQLFRRVECVFGQVRACAYRRPPATSERPRTGTPTHRIGSPYLASHRAFIHRTVASKREHRFVRHGFDMWVLCCVSIERASHESFAPCCHRSNVCRHLQRLDAVRCSTDGDAA